MLIVLGFIIGTILALTGAGGSILAVPALVFALGIDVASAAPVALVAVSLSASVGAAAGIRQKVVRYKAAVLMAGVGTCFAPLGLEMARLLPPAPLAALFGGVLLYVAKRTYGSSQQRHDSDAPPSTAARPCQLDARTGRLSWTMPCARALAASGALTGFLSGLLGVGGGFVIVPALRRASNLGVNAIVTTSLLVVSLVSASAALSALLSNRLEIGAALPFSAGALAGMIAGRRVSGRLADALLLRGFAVLAVAMAIALFVKALRGLT